jgi:formylmethanofuran dehydrogenase subunit E
MTAATDPDLAALAATVVGAYLEPLAALHRVLCPRQVLGVRMALYAGRLLELAWPQQHVKRVLLISEIDGCFADGLMVVSGCSVGHRTLRVADRGKLAVTAVDTETERAVRLWPAPGVRLAACAFAAEATSRWQAQRLGYARMADDALLASRQTTWPGAAQLLAGTEARIACDRCGEDVFYGRQVVTTAGVALCRDCAGV